jgi:hypothetical protein
VIRHLARAFAAAIARLRRKQTATVERPRIAVDRGELRHLLGLRPCDPTPLDPTAAVRAVNEAHRIAEAEEDRWLSLDAAPESQ